MEKMENKTDQEFVDRSGMILNKVVTVCQSENVEFEKRFEEVRE